MLRGKCIWMLSHQRDIFEGHGHHIAQHEAVSDTVQWLTQLLFNSPFTGVFLYSRDWKAHNNVSRLLYSQNLWCTHSYFVGRRQVEVIFLQLCLKQEHCGSGWAFQGDPLCRCHNAVASVVGAARAAAVSDSRLQVWGCALGFNGTSGGLDDSHSSSPCEKPVII